GAPLGEAGPTLRQQWDSGALTNVRKKELLRALIDKVVVRRPTTDKCEVRIIWKGGAWTTAAWPLPVVTDAAMADGEEVIAEVVRRARAGRPDGRGAAASTAPRRRPPPTRGWWARPVGRPRHPHR